MLAMAASSLFSLGESSSLQEQIKDRLGLSFLGLETVNQSSAGRMGYKEIPVTPGGGAQAKPAASESLLTVGKYLTPKLYLSYGRSLVTGGNLFMLRYDIFRHWQLETQSGSESGADVYYKLEFN
jgi:translocation and assembly module TamB